MLSLQTKATAMKHREAFLYCGLILICVSCNKTATVHDLDSSLSGGPGPTATDTGLEELDLGNDLIVSAIRHFEISYKESSTLCETENQAYIVNSAYEQTYPQLNVSTDFMDSPDGEYRVGTNLDINLQTEGGTYIADVGTLIVTVDNDHFLSLIELSGITFRHYKDTNLTYAGSLELDFRVACSVLADSPKDGEISTDECAWSLDRSWSTAYCSDIASRYPPDVLMR